jgi:hypothetical protein
MGASLCRGGDISNVTAVNDSASAPVQTVPMQAMTHIAPAAGSPSHHAAGMV